MCVCPKLSPPHVSHHDYRFSAPNSTLSPRNHRTKYTRSVFNHQDVLLQGFLPVALIFSFFPLIDPEDWDMTLRRNSPSLTPLTAVVRQLDMRCYYSPVAGSRPALTFCYFCPKFILFCLFSPVCVRASMCIQYYLTLFGFSVFGLIPFYLFCTHQVSA